MVTENHDPTDRASAAVHIEWHEVLWGRRTGDTALVNLLVGDPLIAQRLDAFACELFEAKPAEIPQDASDIIDFLLQNPDALQRLGMTCYAPAWCEAMFQGDAGMIPAGVEPDDVRRSFRLMQSVDEVKTIHCAKKASSLQDVEAYGAMVVASWIAGQTQYVKAAIKLRFAPDSAIAQAEPELDSQACGRLLTAFVSEAI